MFGGGGERVRAEQVHAERVHAERVRAERVRAAGLHAVGLRAPARRWRHRCATALCALVLVLAAGPIRAGEISEAKRKLVEELLAISGYADMASQMSEQQALVELMRIRPSFKPMMEFAVSEQRDLSKEEQAKLLEALSSFEKFAESFRERLQGELDFSKIISDVYYPLYDQAFSEDDLRQMVEFYRTPVGRKTIRQMPAIMQSASEAIDRIVRPVSIRVIQDIVAAERERLADGEADPARP